MICKLNYMIWNLYYMMSKLHVVDKLYFFMYWFYYMIFKLYYVMCISILFFYWKKVLKDGQGLVWSIP